MSGGGGVEIGFASVRTVKPARVVLGGAQVLGVAHHPVDGGIAGRQVGHGSRVEVAVRRHYVRRVVAWAIRALGHAHQRRRHVTQTGGL